MRTYLSIINIGCILILFSLLSCNDEEEEIYIGNDNFVLSLALEKDGKSYQALIDGDTLMLNVPLDMNLNNVTVHYKISENAMITPCPDEIKDWCSVGNFTVTSYTNQKRNYKLVINRYVETHHGSVILRTQSEINDFGTKGITHIDGDLILGEYAIVSHTDTIKDLTPLNQLLAVSGNLEIKNSFGGKNLTGLENLTTVGNFFIGSETQMSTLIDSVSCQLPALQSVTSFVVNERKLKQVVLPKLNSAWKIIINGKSLDTVDLSALRIVNGELIIQSGSSSSTSTANESLRHLSLNQLEQVQGTLTIQGLIGLETLNLQKLQSVGNHFTCQSLPKLTECILTSLTTVENAFVIKGWDCYTTFSAENLKKVGSLKIEGNYSLRPLTSILFPNLEIVGSNMELVYTSIKSLNLPKLVTIEGQLKLNYTETLTEIQLPTLRQCSSIYMGSIPLIKSLDFSLIEGLNSVEIISGYILETLNLPKTIGNLKLNGGSKSKKLPEFQNLKEITGKFEISNYTMEDAVVNHVTKIGTYNQNSGSGQKTLTFTALEEIGLLSISLTDLTTLSAPRLMHAETMEWMNLWNLSTVDIKALKTIEKEFKLWGASYSGNAFRCKLSNIDFMKGVNKIGKVNIKWCGYLRNFAGLEQVLPTITAENWFVEGCLYNPSYQDMLDGKSQMN